jgi:hypothetical protein
VSGRLDVRLPDALDAALRRRAAELDRTVTWVVVRSLERWLGLEATPESPAAARPTPPASKATLDLERQRRLNELRERKR